MKRKVEIEINENIGIITISNPPVNSLSVDLIDDMNNVVDNIPKDIKVLIFKGYGKGFCAGADLKERANMSDSESIKVVNSYNLLFNKIDSISCPTIALIHGYALGGGLELALACDFRFSDSKTILGFPETNLGIIPGAGGTQRLSRLIGLSKAKKWIFTANRFKADEALKDNLIDKMFDSLEEMNTYVKEFAFQIINNSQNAVSLSKKAINYALESSLKEGLSFEREQYLKTLNDSVRLEQLKKYKK